MIKMNLLKALYSVYQKLFCIIGMILRQPYYYTVLHSKKYANKFVSETIISKELIKKGNKVLDVGPCWGRQSAPLANYGFEVTAIDPIPQKKWEKINAKFKIGYVENLPFKNSKFDIVTCFLVLGYVKDKDKALSEMWRVLKKNGELILTLPNPNDLRKRIRGSSGSDNTEKLDSLSEIKQRFKKNNFKIKRIKMDGINFPYFEKIFQSTLPLFIIDKLAKSLKPMDRSTIIINVIKR